MKGWRRRAARGALAGVVATGAMSILMLAAQRAGALSKAPPRKVTERLLVGVAGIWPSPRHRLAASVASHLAFGVVAGALFSVLALRVAWRIPRTLAGAAYGAAIWTAMYGYALPALSLMPEPGRDRPGRPTSMAAAHLVYGGVLGALA